jgi:hypothetical protein
MDTIPSTLVLPTLPDPPLDMLVRGVFPAWTMQDPASKHQVGGFLALQVRSLN